jgi:hypothetical protein
MRLSESIDAGVSRQWQRSYDRMAPRPGPEGLAALQGEVNEVRATADDISRRMVEGTIAFPPFHPMIVQAGLDKPLVGVTRETIDAELKSQLIDRILRTRRLLLGREEYLRAILHDRKMEIFWPDGMNNDMMQGGAGDCYLLAALYLLKKHPKGQMVITDNIFFDENNGAWRVSPMGAEDESVITLNQDKLYELELAGKALRVGSLGDRLIERAYAELVDRRHRRKGKMEGLELVNGERMAFEGGASVHVFRDLAGDRMKTRVLDADEAVDTFFRMEQDNLLMVAGSYSLSEARRRGLNIQPHSGSYPESVRYLVNDGAKQHLLKGPHAYAIDQVFSQSVILIDPHDTSRPIRMGIGAFKQAFQSVQKGELL